MSIKRGYQPAMPQPPEAWAFEENPTGLSVREQFAMAAMQGYMTGQLAWSDSLHGGFVPLTSDECAKEAVDFADALLAELERTK